MAYYVGILDGSKNVWGVRIPDVRGCYGGGATPEAAIADAISALREFAAHQAGKGISLNPPRTVHDVREDPDAEFDAAAGESFVMVPLILDQARPVKANISLDAGVLQAIDEAAEVRGLTRSAFVISATLSKIVEEPISEEAAKLRAQLAAAHKRLADQAAQFMTEMRRIGGSASEHRVTPVTTIKHPKPVRIRYRSEGAERASKKSRTKERERHR